MAPKGKAGKIKLALSIADAQQFEVQALKFGPVNISGEDYTVYLVPVKRVKIDKLVFEIS